MQCSWCGQSDGGFYPDRNECRRCHRWFVARRKVLGRSAFREWKQGITAERFRVFQRSYRPADGWRPVLGYEARYEVNDQGQVRSLTFHGRPRPEPKVLQQFEHDFGYHSVTLVDAAMKKHTMHIHRLVLEAFRGLPPAGHVAGHRDGNGRNNALANLDWITYHENEIDKRAHGRSLQGERNHQAKLTENKVRLMRQMRERMGWSYQKLATLFAVSLPVAHKICLRKSWQHVA